MVIQLGLEFIDNWDCHRMDHNSHNRQHRQRQRHHHHRSRDQSFSSALLDAICKSTEDEGGMMAHTKSSNRQDTRNIEAENYTVMRNSSYRRVVGIESQWDEDPWLNNEKFMRGRSAKMGVFNSEKNEVGFAYSKLREFHPSLQSNMSSAALCSSDYTSDSTSSCPYLSSDAESLSRHTSSISTAKTGRNSYHLGREDTAGKWAVGGSRALHGKSSVREGDFRSKDKPFIPADRDANFKSKSQSRKDSKKPKKPTSPGRKLANFLNSLFMAGSTKKPKLSSSSSVSDSNSYDSSEKKPASVYSSSSSVQSRPCLSKTSKGSKSSTGMSQRSVTFYPASVIVDENSNPCEEKCLHRMEKYPPPDPNPANHLHTYPSTDAYKLPLLSKELRFHMLEEDWHAAAAKDIISKYQKANNIMEAVVIRSLDKQDEEEEEEDDDDASCSSSDLFELENLAEIDMNMSVYQKELPVYETTHLETNKAIARGLFV
jgi:hypothetical protein